MLEYSINATDEYAKNKTSRYVKKYVLLVNVINDMLEHLNCDIPENVNGMRVVNCSRNINKDCMNNKVEDPEKSNENINKKILDFYRNNDTDFMKEILNKVPFNLKCAMYRVLSNIKERDENPNQLSKDQKVSFDNDSFFTNGNKSLFSSFNIVIFVFVFIFIIFFMKRKNK